MILFALDLLAMLAIGVFAIFGLALPLAALGGQFFHHASGLWDPEVLAAAKITVLQASISALIATALGTLIALELPRDSRWVRALLGMPFGVPAIAAATAWILCMPHLFSYSLSAVIIAHVFFNVPWVALWVCRALDDIPSAQLEAARTLGASRFSAFREVAVPYIAPSVSGALCQVFSLCAMSFVLVMILGGGPPIDTLETTLFAKIRTGGLDLSAAGACAIWQIAITLAPWILLRSIRGARTLDTGRASRERRPSHPARLAFGLVASAIFVLPYLALFSHAHLSTLSDQAVLSGEVLPAFWVSARLAVWTAFVSVVIAVLGIWAEERNRFFARFGSPVLVLPAGISVMVLGLGFFIAYGKYLDPFSASLAPIVALESMLFVPVAFRALQPIARGRNREAWDAALTLGASPRAAFAWVEWPRWRGPAAGILALVAGAALGEVAAVSLFYNEGRIPAALLIYRWSGQYRFEQAQALSLLLMIAAALLILSGMWVGFDHPEVKHE